jgi:nucleoside-diphosphate-sugar epimerase
VRESDYITKLDEKILITGSGGFIGSKLVATLLEYGFTNLWCFVRPSTNLRALNENVDALHGGRIRIFEGNLISFEDCKRATEGASVIFHLAAVAEKTFPGCYINSVITTKNLLESVRENGHLKRFVNVSSIVVYSDKEIGSCKLLDEKIGMEKEPSLRFEAYTYGKVKQDELVLEYAKKFDIPYVIVRPGDVYGPGKRKISGRVGIDTFGIFLHLGGQNQIPLTYVDNCAEAIVMVGIKKGVDGEIFNIVDDNLPTSKTFLKMYKREVNYFKSIYIPYRLLYFLCYLWEKYSVWSRGQLPPAFNRKRCVANWKGIGYSNRKIKEMLGWKPRVDLEEGLARYFAYMREGGEDN